MIEQEYGIKTKPDSSGNSQANATIDRIHHFLGNLVRTYYIQETYVDDADPWMVILASAYFVVRSMNYRTEQQSPGKLVFGRYMILPINNIANWRYICQRK